MPNRTSDFQDWARAQQARVEQALARLLPPAELAPQRLHAAMRYAVLGGGKRVRHPAHLRRRGTRRRGGGQSSSPPGALDHIKLALLAQSAGVAPKDIRYVAFQGGADALAALLGGHVAAFVGDAGEIAAHTEAGTVLPLATLSPNRLHGIYKDTPTAKELGVDVISGNWRGFYGPPEMPKEAQAYWRDTLSKMIKTDGWKQVLQQNAWIELYQTGDQLDAFLTKELVSYEKILADLGMKK